MELGRIVDLNPEASICARTKATHRRRLIQLLLTLSLPLLMGQEDCTPNPDPKTMAKPVALDCVIGGTQVFIPFDLTVALDRFPTAGTGMRADITAASHIPSDVFCALANLPITQMNLQSSNVVVEFDGVMPPGTMSAPFSMFDNLPISLDVAAHCASGIGLHIDYGTIPTSPWSDGEWTVDFMVRLDNMRFWLTNITPSPPAFIDLIDLCDPTDKSIPRNGTVSDPEDSPRIAADRDGDGVYEALATATDQIQFNVNGYCVGKPCNDFNDCTIDHCDHANIGWCTWDDEPDATACDLAGNPGVCSTGSCVECLDVSDCAPTGECSEATTCAGNACVIGAPLPFGTACSVGGCDGAGSCFADPQPPCNPAEPSCTKVISLACTNNVVADVLMQDFELTVTADPVIAGAVVPVSYSGAVRFPEIITDAAQGGVPGGVISGDLAEAKATVHVRSGAIGADVTLTAAPLPTTCLIGQTSCDPANDLPSIPTLRPNPDCIPTGTFNPCQQVVAFPTSFDCAQGGTCELLGKSVQCEVNGFCITGPLEIPLVGESTSITPDASGQVLFGWDDQSTGAALKPDGTWSLPPSTFTDPLGPNGIKLNASGLAVALECTMAVPSDGPYGTIPPVPDQSSPTPDSQLINFPIQVP
ncbi:MAG: hypothetical protein WBM48_11895 [Polyangiales bacterium]